MKGVKAAWGAQRQTHRPKKLKSSRSVSSSPSWANTLKLSSASKRKISKGTRTREAV